MFNFIEPTETTSIPRIDILRLQAQFKKAGLPIDNVRINCDLTVVYDWVQVPTAEQFQLAAEILTAHDPDDRSDDPDVSTEEKMIILQTQVFALQSAQSTVSDKLVAAKLMTAVEAEMISKKDKLID